MIEIRRQLKENQHNFTNLTYIAITTTHFTSPRAMRERFTVQIVIFHGAIAALLLALQTDAGALFVRREHT